VTGAPSAAAGPAGDEVLDAPVEASLPGGWLVRRVRGDAGTLHGLAVPAGTGREVWVLEAARPAVVLGSTQAESLVDAGAAAELGVDVVRRRSGGGAVLVVPDDMLWLDVVLPAGDPLWDTDVARATAWLGDTWVAALADVGIAPTVAHRGALACGRLGRLVCFASLGAGEVTQDGRKLVGVSQRRTRTSARFQCGLYRVWEPGPLVRLLRLDAEGADDLATAALGTDRPGADVLAAFLSRLPR
jgi:lipoate---protein ligase